MRAFYENLPDLRSLVPAVLLKDALGGPNQSGGGTHPSDPGDGSGAAAAELPAGIEDIDAEAAAALAAVMEAEASQENTTTTPLAAEGRNGGTKDVDEEPEGGADGTDEQVAAAGGGGDAAENLLEPSTLDLILNRLPTCVTRELCDELAVNFCYCNSKSARKRLVKVLVGVPRGSLQLLPYYARVAATLSQLYPDVGQGGWDCRTWGAFTW
jgi:regulator of nonsense transcripts 2